MNDDMKRRQWEHAVIGGRPSDWKYRIASERNDNIWWSKPNDPPVSDWWSVANYARLEAECNAKRESEGSN